MELHKEVAMQQKPNLFGTVVGYAMAAVLFACVLAALGRLLLWILGL